MAAKKTATKKKSTTEPSKAKKVTPKATAKTTTKAVSSPKKTSASNGVAKPKTVKAKAVQPATEAAKTVTEAKPAAAKPVAKKAAPIKLNDRQVEFLKKIHEAGVPGYKTGQKVELRTIDALVDRKLVKRGPKDKESGQYHYQASKAGEKFLANQQGL